MEIHQWYFSYLPWHYTIIQILNLFHFVTPATTIKLSNPQITIIEYNHLSTKFSNFSNLQLLAYYLPLYTCWISYVLHPQLWFLSLRWFSSAIYWQVQWLCLFFISNELDWDLQNPNESWLECLYLSNTSQELQIKALNSIFSPNCTFLF